MTRRITVELAAKDAQELIHTSGEFSAAANTALEAIEAALDKPQQVHDLEKLEHSACHICDENESLWCCRICYSKLCRACGDQPCEGP